MADLTAGPHPDAPVLPPCWKCGSLTREHRPDCWFDDPDDGEPDACSHCGGDIWTECDDPIQCCDPRCDGTMHPCRACLGTGLASRQVIW